MRTAIKDFALANRLYAGATVTFYTVSGGAKTATKATLYVGATGSSTLGNPQVLGSDGKLRRAVYVDVPTIATVSGLTVPDHDTGIINPAPSFRISPTTFELEYSYDGGTTWTSSASTLFKHRGAWVTATAYARTDTFTDSGTLYYVVTAHTSAASLATDVSAGRVVAVSSLSLPLSLANGGLGASHANVAAVRTTLGLGTAAVVNTGSSSGNVPALNASSKLDAAVLSRTVQPLSAAVAANALTLTLAAGALLEFGDGTAVSTTAALTLTVSSGSTLGSSSGAASRLWVVAMKNGGTPELAVINTWNGTDVYEVLASDTISTTAEGGAGAADSAHVWYSTTTRSSQAIAVVGYVESTQATAGTWATSPSLTQGWGRGIPLPGQVIQTRRKSHAGGATSYGSTAGVIDNTIPQNTEGVELTDLAVAITPRSALNLLRSEAFLALRVGVAAQTMIGVFRDSTADAVWAFDQQPDSGVFNQATLVEFLAGTTSSTTTKIRIGVNGGAAVRLGADASDAAVFGGVSKSIHTVMEIMR